MTKQEFSLWVKDKIIYLDGATGSNLMKAGMPAGVCTEKWVNEHPEAIQSLQKAYVDAGSMAVYAPTFMANRISLKNIKAMVRSFIIRCLMNLMLLIYIEKAF